jgi:hypothetical protein
VQRLKERQSVLVMVGERLAVCTVMGFHDGRAVLRTTERQAGGPMPEFSEDAQLTFEHGPNLVMLNGTLEHGFAEGELLFGVSDGVQVPPRRRDTRRRLRLPVTLVLPGGEERRARTTDVSSRGLGVEGVGHAEMGEVLGVRLSLPDGGLLVATGSVVRITADGTALLLESFQEGSRDQLAQVALHGTVG